jgi:hypothetical protein
MEIARASCWIFGSRVVAVRWFSRLCPVPWKHQPLHLTAALGSSEAFKIESDGFQHRPLRSAHCATHLMSHDSESQVDLSSPHAVHIERRNGQSPKSSASPHKCALVLSTSFAYSRSRLKRAIRSDEDTTTWISLYLARKYITSGTGEWKEHSHVLNGLADHIIGNL